MVGFDRFTHTLHTPCFVLLIKFLREKHSLKLYSFFFYFKTKLNRNSIVFIMQKKKEGSGENFFSYCS
ncbi:hypothetical protein GLOIN_2v1578418 [Rhizophagus irregularis DAOM 181602=DAOM 197198]|uniref:Uncharacterized protein n=1 Tax=Rhizophagus irregularis (strain DAOM 181602 / DAOM 197198 / MUCL 43194) TaxID=747089 RepID=A0A2P4Q970_RHIID|nr:hypothetical protein GLOIN_2v1578418 [Rhizophagus irregularis DAOM 181602=DAOM 197198]POG74179.1 hypothetical protein GLOIN_2v1578418 [Rhizophagus irregularis DAOM 181602=DAOM 197198]GET59147.1 hypothetical protein GLOIN_2v1578418 [Rhizophagus irregularis DAOM 181602=DAOM 197198]|eukprot:XP_025181045.1 hypothetical protein GLOIN_2v1578418 [Rhizophagus irregularis DAOM 181602=DAOM 197198]